MTTLVATFDGLLEVDDGTVTRRLTDVRPDCVARTNGVNFVGTTDEGLWRATDGDWARVDGLPDRITAVTAGADGEVWAGTEPSRVFRSTDSGETWAECEGLDALDSSDAWSFPPRPETHHVRWLERRPDALDSWYVAIEAGALLRTDDAGDTWHDRVPSGPLDTHTMATHPDRPGWAAAASGDGYHETTDGGDQWSTHQVGLEHTYCWSVAVDRDPSLRVLSAASGAHHAHREGVSFLYRRVDGEWARVDGLPTGDGVYRYVLRATGDGFLAASNTGLFRSPDGDDWERLLPASALPDGTVRGLT